VTYGARGGYRPRTMFSIDSDYRARMRAHVCVLWLFTNAYHSYESTYIVRPLSL